MQLMQHSAQLTRSDWQHVVDFDYCVTIRDGEQTRTYAGSMLEGSPFEQLVAVNGVPVSEQRLREETAAIGGEDKRRRRESTEERTQRIAQYEKEQQRNQTLLNELIKAFQFEWTGTAAIDGWQTDVFRVTPLASYRPRGIETQVLTGMEGTLWMDQKSYRWVHAEAEVIHPVSIVGFLARVERGTRFMLDERPVAGGTWLMSHFVLHSKTRILFLFSSSSTSDYSYFHYVPRGTLKPRMCLEDSGPVSPN